MTFAVVSVANETEKVVGTIWANAESEAHEIATNLVSSQAHETVIVRRAEETEIPFKLSN
jgi:hypothetical protein